jgi:hypothetical protein
LADRGGSRDGCHVAIMQLASRVRDGPEGRAGVASAAGKGLVIVGTSKPITKGPRMAIDDGVTMMSCVPVTWIEKREPGAPG